MTPAPARRRIPRAAARRRPFWQRPVEGAPRAARTSRDRRRRADGHLAPPGAGAAGSSARVRAGLRELFALPDGYEVALGNGGATAFWDAAAFGLVRERALHLVNGEFSSKFAERDGARAVPRRPDRASPREPGSAPGAGGSAGRRRDRLGAQRDLDRRDDRGAAARRRRRRAGRDRRHLGRRRPAARRRAQADAYYFAPQKSFASDGGLWLALLSPAALERVAADRRVRALHPRLPVAADRARRTRARTRPYNTPAIATLYLLAEQIDWMLAGGGLDWCVARTRESSGHLYGWARARARSRRRSSPTRRCARWSSATIDFDDIGRRRRARRDAARQRDRRRRALPQARPQPAARRDVPRDRARRRAGADRLHRLRPGALRRGGGASRVSARVLVREDVGESGPRAAARALRGRDRLRLVGRGAGGADRRVRRDPDPLGDEADRGADRARRAAARHRPRRRRGRQRRRRRRRRGAGSSSPTRRSPTS